MRRSSREAEAYSGEHIVSKGCHSLALSRNLYLGCARSFGINYRSGLSDPCRIFTWDVEFPPGISIWDMNIDLGHTKGISTSQMTSRMDVSGAHPRYVCHIYLTSQVDIPRQFRAPERERAFDESKKCILSFLLGPKHGGVEAAFVPLISRSGCAPRRFPRGTLRPLITPNQATRVVCSRGRACCVT